MPTPGGSHPPTTDAVMSADCVPLVIGCGVGIGGGGVVCRRVSSRGHPSARPGSAMHGGTIRSAALLHMYRGAPIVSSRANRTSAADAPRDGTQWRGWACSRPSAPPGTGLGRWFASTSYLSVSVSGCRIRFRGYCMYVRRYIIDICSIAAGSWTGVEWNKPAAPPWRDPIARSRPHRPSHRMLRSV